MIRIIFDNGELMECEHINRIYIDESEMDKIHPVLYNKKEEVILKGFETFTRMMFDQGQ